ncbi:hypothetical protein GALL_235110 [mine drainage metagenome]|uniref:Uncharacterized protein n=1 Tax=mine drainage metagenome TaxID=410659 RepID=A0A1J5RFJ6_9ZZZZ
MTIERKASLSWPPLAMPQKCAYIFCDYKKGIYRDLRVFPWYAAVFLKLLWAFCEKNMVFAALFNMYEPYITKD